MIRRLVAVLAVVAVFAVTLGLARVRNHREEAFGPSLNVGTAAVAVRDTVTRIHDGDTFYTVNYPDGVRLIGADTPEVTNNSHGRIGCWGKQATARLRQLIPETGPVVLVLGQGTSHHRALATVQTADHVDVAAVLIREGLAVVLTVSPNVEHAADYEALQVQAKTAGVGVWSGHNPPDAPKGCVNPPGAPA